MRWKLCGLARRSNSHGSNGYGGSEPKAKPPLLSYFDQLAEKPPKKEWLIKGVISRGETSSWIAAPGKGKSSLLTDLAVHLPTAPIWRGHRIKQRSGVVYFALERGDLVERRLVAYKQRDGLSGVPIAVCKQIVDLLHKQSTELILAIIREAEQNFGCEVGLVIFDTYSKGIAAGGGDEDKAKDQNIVQANLRRLFDRGGNFHIAGIGHTGKDESRGERGSNARLADVDVEIQIKGDAIRSAVVTKANDQAGGELTSFQLAPFDFEPDEDGDQVRVFIVDKEIYTRPQTAEGNLKPHHLRALEALAEVTLTYGQDAPPEYGDVVPAGIKVVAYDKWREELLRANVIVSVCPYGPQAIRRARTRGLGHPSFASAVPNPIIGITCWPTRP